MIDVAAALSGNTDLVEAGDIFYSTASGNICLADKVDESVVWYYVISGARDFSPGSYFSTPIKNAVIIYKHYELGA